MKQKQLSDSITPIQILFSGFIGLSLIGCFLLMLPFASAHHTIQPCIDAWFTAVSAITGTGITLVDTGTYYSLAGQIILLSLIQIGNLGYMVFIVLIVVGIGGKLSFSNRVLLHQSIANPTSVDLIKFTKIVIFFTILFEACGSLFLSLYWMNDYPPHIAWYYGIFHTISAFCTAGFSLFPNNICAFHTDPYVLSILLFLCIGGGIGFFPLYDIYTRCKKTVHRVYPRYFSRHTAFVVCLSAILMGSGTLALLLLDTSNTSFKERFLHAVFQAVSASSTTGYNSVTISQLGTASILVIMVLMFIGSSPGGTGGGIKTTTIGILFLFLHAFFHNQTDVIIFNRKIPARRIAEACAIVFMGIFWVLAMSFLLILTQKAAPGKILFEVISSLGNVGLSMDITSSFNTFGKFLLSMTMLIGRVGPLAIGYSLFGRPKSIPYKYAEADILVG